MKVFLRPLYSQLNPGIGQCPIGCQQVCKVHQHAPSLQPPSGYTCPLSLHQAETCAQVAQSDADIIFNTAATGDGKSLAGYLPGLLNPNFRVMGLYPTIELVADQERQICGEPNQIAPSYLQTFNAENRVRVDSLYGVELARRVEAANKSNKFNELLRSLEQKIFILTNPDIFHLITHSRYFNPASNTHLLPSALARYPDLYIADEFHIFGVHQEAAILNSLLLIRHARVKKRRLRVLFTSATPKPEFIRNLQKAGFKVATIAGHYRSEATAGFRPILQPVTLQFEQLEPKTDALSWLKNQKDTIQAILETDGNGRGRGLIILNSVAMVSQAVRELQTLLPKHRVKVKEISGRIDRQERAKIQAELRNAPESVLVVATSAVDVGVDFRIHLLIFEASDSATFIQRLGRLGRHDDFVSYKAFALLPGRAPWIMARIQEKLVDGQTLSRVGSEDDLLDLREVIEYALESHDRGDHRKHYSAYWGALQAQGMLLTMSRPKDKETPLLVQPLQDSIMTNLRNVYGEQLDRKKGHWHGLGNDKAGTGKAIQQELLRFRGGSDLQAAVWDQDENGTRFYTYNLLRLLPYVEVELLDRDTFLTAAIQHNHAAIEFDDRYIQLYLRVRHWLNKAEPIELKCDRGADRITECTLTLLDRVSITGHFQAEISRCLQGRKLLAFVVQVRRSQPNSHWDVSNTLHLSPLFGLYRLTDLDDQAYACAFNQDALLLESLKWRLKPCERTKPYIF